MADAYSGGAVLAEVVRSGFVESRHHGSVAVLDAAGTVVASVGDVANPIFPRSSNKPMQAVAMLRAGLELADPADLALVAASHWGEPVHIDRIRAMLRAGDLREDDLRCPPDLPLSETARTAVLQAGGTRTRIYMNCSGKHTGMLLTCRAAGWPPGDYRSPEHPLQRACLAAVGEFAGEPVAAHGVDGCGAAVAAISLQGLARALLAVVSAPPGSEPRRVADAMRAHPELVSGPGATDDRLMRAVPGLLSKGGAEGVLAVALPGTGAVAIKIDDGNARGQLPVLVAALASLGVTGDAVDSLAHVPVIGGGVEVGHVRALPALF
jgi:L-asparaginase II